MKKYIDAEGREIPGRFISRQKRKADKVVESVFRDVKRYREQTAKVKQRIEKKVEEYLKYLAEEYKTGKDWKGNAVIMNIAQDKRIGVQVHTRVEFDERIMIAKQKIDSCLSRWSDGAKEELRMIVQQAFSVNRKGMYDRKQLFGLMKLQIRDKEWQDAMELIKESMQVVIYKTYMYFEERNERGEWKRLPMNYTDIEV